MLRKSTKRPTSVTAPKAELPRPRRIAFGAAMVRIFLVAALALGATIWGVVRHFTHPFKPMLVPAGSTDLPAPEIEVTFDPPTSVPSSAPTTTPSGLR